MNGLCWPQERPGNRDFLKYVNFNRICTVDGAPVLAKAGSNKMEAIVYPLPNDCVQNA